jgi:DNA-binding NarL/FixJ family response regulator
MRFLIVDDQPVVRQSMKALLEVWHLPEEVREAASGSEAVQLVEECQPDIVLMDVRMPMMSGLEATRLIKTRWPEIKVIVLSIYPEYQTEALMSGADAFIVKGTPLPEILRMIQLIWNKDQIIHEERKGD